VAKVVETPNFAEQGRSPAAFEALITDLSWRFINLSPDGVDQEIEEALRRVSEFLDIDWSVLWQWSDADLSVLTATHTYPPQGASLPSATLRQEQFPWVIQQMREGRIIAFQTTREEAPAEAAIDVETARLAGIKSNLDIPLAVGGEPPLGALAFNTLREPRQWSDALVTRLQLVAQIFTSALARRRADETLRQSEERLSLAADAAEAGLWALDYRTRVLWVTDRTRAIFGFAPDEVVTWERFQSTVHPDDRGLIGEAVERSAQGDEFVSLDYRILTAEGEVRWVVARGRPHFSAAGEPDRLMGVALDITERKLADEALLASEARLAAAAELAGLGFYEVDFVAGSSFIDERFCDIFGVPPDRQQGLQPIEFWMEHLHPDDRPEVLDRRQQLYSGKLTPFSMEYRFLHPTQGEKWIQHSAGVAMCDASGHATKSQGILRDVTERKQAELELRDLSRRLMRAQEEERALLARELHDDVSQRLAVLAIEAGQAELAAADGAEAEALQAVREGLVRLSEDVHSLAYQLHPAVLKELGLAAALAAEGERRGAQGLHVWVNLDPLPAALSEDTALCLFRVAQEALNNVARHAGARMATVRLREADGGLLLAVSDDGVGFEPASTGKGMHLGLAGMRERLRLVGGSLDIESSPGEGTTVIAWVPAQEGP
jgi:PAS domain S-box-containing protein